MPSQTQPPLTVLVSSRGVSSGHPISPMTLVFSSESGLIHSLHREVLPQSAFPAGTLYTDHSPHVLMPGLVDAHVHLNEPGRTEWEGFWTGTRAAASGGVTTVIDMPLNSIPPTTTVNGLDQKVRAAEGQCWVDVGFYGGIVPGNEGELAGLVRRGVRGFKGFLIDSGVDEFPAVSPADVAKAMAQLANEPTTLMFHAEMLPPDSTTHGKATHVKAPANSYQTFLASRPPTFETEAIGQIIALAHLAPKLPLHIVHLSTVEAIPLLQRAREQGVRITAETCFHYLALAAEDVPDGDTRYKCCPPVRNQHNRERLWEELLKREHGVVGTVVSDHSPCTPNLKHLPPSIPGFIEDDRASDKIGDFLHAWGGVSSLGFGLSLLWTEGQPRGVTIEDIVTWCCANTAKQVGLDHRKGSLDVGLDADIVIFDDGLEWVVGPEEMQFRNKCSPYQGKRLKGRVKESWIRGARVWNFASGFEDSPKGHLILEERKHPGPSR